MEARRCPGDTGLGHVKRYVNLEQMRYGEKLQVEYDVQDVEFLIPPLTIQPVMENAIKYGAGDKRGGGTRKLMLLERGSYECDCSRR